MVSTGGVLENDETWTYGKKDIHHVTRFPRKSLRPFLKRLKFSE